MRETQPQTARLIPTYRPTDRHCEAITHLTFRDGLTAHTRKVLVSVRKSSASTKCTRGKASRQSRAQRRKSPSRSSMYAVSRSSQLRSSSNWSIIRKISSVQGHHVGSNRCGHPGRAPSCHAGASSPPSCGSITATIMREHHRLHDAGASPPSSCGSITASMELVAPPPFAPPPS